MEAIKNHWVTGLALLATAVLILSGFGMIISGGSESEAGVRVYGAVMLLGGLVLLSGLWGLRSGRLNLVLAHVLVVAGAIVFGVGLWWLVLVPPVIALVVVYSGVVRRGLERELRPA